MSLLADFDPLNSPSNNGVAASSPAAAATNQTSPNTAATNTQKKTNQFTGLKLDYLYSSKWQSLRSTASHTYSLKFEAPRPKVASTEEDPIQRIQREKEEKERKEKEEREKREAEEQARQEEARKAAAAGKEDIPEDQKKVELPGPSLSEQSASASAVAQPVDPKLAAGQSDLSKLSEEHEREIADRNRYAEKPTFTFTSSDVAGSSAGEIAALATNTTVWRGVVQLQPPNTIQLADVTKDINKEGQHNKQEVQGTFTLELSSDGKKLSGKIEDETVEFEVFDSSNLDSLLGL